MRLIRTAVIASIRVAISHSRFLVLIALSLLAARYSLFAETKELGTPAISTGSWATVPKILKPQGAWGISVSSGLDMVYSNGNWYVRISTNVDFDSDGLPDPLIEGNEYEYNYLFKEGANYYLEQTTISRKIVVPDFSPGAQTLELIVNDNFGFAPPPPQSITGFFTEVGTNVFTITLQWDAPRFNTQKATNAAGPFVPENNRAIDDLFIYQIWRSTSTENPNISSASWTQKGSLLAGSSLEFIDTDGLEAGVTYYYAMRSLDAYDPPGISQFSAPVPVNIKGGVSVAIKILLTVDVSKLSGNSNAVFVTVKVPGQTKNILEKAPLKSNGDGTWSIAFLDTAISAGKKIQYRYYRRTDAGEETEPDQPTASKEHEFMLDSNNPMIDKSTVPWFIAINDRWGIPTFDETPMGMPNSIASLFISSGSVQINGVQSIGTLVEMRFDPEKAFVKKESEDGVPEIPQGNYLGIRYFDCNNNTLPSGGVKIYYSTSTDLLAPVDEVLASSPTVPLVAYGEPVVKVIIEPPLVCELKVAMVGFDGQIVGRPSRPIHFAQDVPKVSEVTFQNLGKRVNLEIKPGDKTGKINLFWKAPEKIEVYGAAHSYDIVYATFPIENLATLKKAKFAGRIGANMPGSAESFSIRNMGDTAPGYYIATIPIYDDWSSTSGAKITISVTKIGVAPKRLDLSSRKDAKARMIVKGASGDTINLMGYVAVSTSNGDALKKATLEIPRGGLDSSQVIAVVKNSREIANDETIKKKIDLAKDDVKISATRISKALVSLNDVDSKSVASSIVSYEISDLAGNYYFDKEEKVAKLPMKISVPIPASWRDDNKNGVLDFTENTEEPVRLSDLRVYRLNTKGNFWELVNEGMQEVDLVHRVVKAEVKKLSTFALFAPGGAAKDLANLVVYPNPFVPFDEICENGFPFGESCGGLLSDKSGITFDNLTANSEIFIYTLSMDLVRYHKLTGSGIEEQTGKWRWDGRNDAGEFVASGVYIYMVKDEGAQGVTKKSGRVVIVR